MTITAIRLQNFMAFGEVENENEGWIELRPISLLYGRNSSGKSAIIRALRLLKQSLFDAPEGARFAFNVEDGLDAGNHKSIIHGNNLDRFSYHTGEDDWEDWIETKDNNGEIAREKKKKTVEFAFALSFPSKRLRDFLPSSELKTDTKQIRFILRFGWLVVEEVFDLISFTLEVPSYNPIENHIIFEGGRLPKNDLTDEMGHWWFGSDSLAEYTEQDNLTIWRTLEVLFVHGFLPELYTPKIARQWVTREAFHVSRLLEDVHEEIVDFLQKIQYVHPIRPEPQRSYLLDASDIKRWERRGLQAYLQLLRRDTDLPYTRLNTWLTRLQLGLSIKPEPSTDQPEGSVVSKILIQEKGSDFEINLIDVGFGAAQVIPILITSLLASENSLVIIEQPELHLHPEAQAILADLFIECATLRNLHFLIETHSEHLMLRFRRRIAETTLDSLEPNHEQFPQNDGFPLQRHQFGFDFVKRNEGVSNIEVIKVNHRGQLIAPSEEFRDFFDDDLTEASLLARAKVTILGIEYDGEDSN